MSAPPILERGPDRPSPPLEPGTGGPLYAAFRAIRGRILSGLIAALPIVLTFWIIYWLYSTLKQVVLDPAVEVVRYFLGHEGMADTILFKYVSPVIAVFLVLGSLYFLGLFVRSRLHRAVDFVMLHVPIVNTIFKAVSGVIQSVGQQLEGGQENKRVVLVPFPHAGARSLAFVTNTIRDEATDRTILCVCVLTGVMPPAGFTLFFPEEEVTDIDWTANQTIQAILSGGLTAPGSIPYFPPDRIA